MKKRTLVDIHANVTRKYTRLEKHKVPGTKLFPGH